ncbi:ATP-binding cassette sub-family A member 8-A-like [Octodon degus]|uniref:ATP-binding cassette sub-family A member 8-A-like n=1 Tax=Octodon degus TaxID=10160 RepID=A0A6P6ECC4_OCTDE|nr:ATP-binding cassette sub-family A member 8-A-like [Octodon degus]XP_023569921.1 ATP-binding cassette sub-family A member 8-A-like [Octodon degus]
MVARKISVWKQTWALFCKNLLKKRRMKRDTVMEWFYSAFLLVALYTFSTIPDGDDFSSNHSVELGRIDSFKHPTFVVAYAPFNQTMRKIMKKASSASSMTGIKIIALHDKENMTELISIPQEDVVRVVFTNPFSYHLKFLQGFRNPTMLKHRDHSAHCYEFGDSLDCSTMQFQTKIFVALQAAINAAIIELTTNHSVMDELMAVTGEHMKLDSFLRQEGTIMNLFMFTCITCFSPFTYYVSVYVTRERKKMKGWMTIMGLRDPAFWFSWALLYAGFVLILAFFLALITKSVQFVILTGFTVVFSLFFFYGLSLITLTFLMSVLLKKSFLTGFVVFLFTVVWGLLGLLALYRHLPASLEWTFSLFSPFAFTFGMSQLLHVDFEMSSKEDSTSDSNLIIATISMLFLDAFCYLALTFYFEKILPNEYGRRHPPWFFLKSSFWNQQKTPDRVALEDETEAEFSNEAFEAVSTEFHGKEAIRIRNLTKEYRGKPKGVEALKDLTFNIYEGQITTVLGHNGAGKSTLLNILTGMCVPTKGWVAIYDNKLSEMTDLENISKLTGVCPQVNVQFDFLTVRENLRLFAKIKGIQPHEVDNEVQRVLQELEMKTIQDSLAENLSGGQKRKLTFGIATLGDPRIFLLDEPTAGLDPFSRHRIWNFLKERKADRVILFSTQFMDEADILAERKVFLSQGRLKCAGSSLFLKKKWGIGYHLSLQLDETCVHKRITSLVKQHIPDAKLSAERAGKLTYTLPLERTNKFPDLYRDLESCTDLGIEDYGVSMTTLNEVFLKLQGKPDLDQPDIGTLEDVQAEGTRDTGRLFETEEAAFSPNGMYKTKTGMALLWQQVCAVARVRFLKIKREKKVHFTLVLLLIGGLLHILTAYLRKIVSRDDHFWGLSPQMYFLTPGQRPRDPLSSLLIINKTGASIDGFIHSLEKQNIALEVDASGTRDGTEELSYNGAITVSGDSTNHRFSLACNTRRPNCFPVLVDVVSNGLLGTLAPSARICTHRSSYPRVEAQSYQFSNLVLLILWITLMPSLSPSISMTSVDDYKNKAQFQLWISGLIPSAYWFGQALVEVGIYLSLILLMYVAFYALKLQGDIYTTADIFIQILYIVGYSLSIIFMTYVISFIFRGGRKNSGIWSFCFYFVTVVSTVFMIDFFKETSQFWASIFIPPATLVGCTLLHFDNRVSVYSGTNSTEQEKKDDFLVFLVSYVHFMIFLVTLRCLEWKLGNKTMRKDPIFRISTRSSRVFHNPEDPEREDADVQLERVRTANALTSPNFEQTPAIIASCLRKEYTEKKCLFFKKKKKIATRNVSFCVRKGEILGLLGHNGAGKSTCIRMITGETKPSAGQVLLRGSNEADPLGFLGFCPQENVLWPNLTVREHLEVFAAVKGLSKADAPEAIARLVEALKLQAQLQATVKTLSEGIKRKLCFALSILGNPSVALLDEPSTGMDPEGQQQIWRAARATFTNTERGALLTTHYMAEAEAVCDRVAIMVSGKLRCIGSIQHLKSKFGKDYLLEMKVKTPANVEPLHTEILRLFPQAARQERYSSLMVYKVPVEDVQPLSQAFFKLETVKQSFEVEEYSLSQSTLEQVFLELSKEQELGDFDEELDSTMKWKLLPPEEA